jgi:transcriptional regulator with XRE-family HTH domain
MRAIMEHRNISQAALARAVGMSKKGIANIINKVNQPFEDTLVKIGAALGVKWRSLIEGYDGDAEKAEEGGGVATKTTVDLMLDIRNNGMTPEQVTKFLMSKLDKSVDIADVIRITILRDEK